LSTGALLRQWTWLVRCEIDLAGRREAGDDGEHLLVVALVLGGRLVVGVGVVGAPEERQR
jgi:hypothetical protein